MMKKVVGILIAIVLVQGTTLFMLIQEKRQERRIAASNSRGLRVLTYRSKFSGLKIEAKRADTSWCYRLWLVRDNEPPFEIRAAPNETWQDLVVAARTNKAVVLVKTVDESWQNESGAPPPAYPHRLVEITLPSPEQPLSAVSIRTLPGSERYTSATSTQMLCGLSGISADGAILLVEKYNVERRGSQTLYDHCNSVFDLEHSEFIDPEFRE